MEPTAAAAQPPPSATSYSDSMDSSPRSRNTDSWGEDNSLYPSNHGSSAPPAQLGLTKLRLMCSYGGHIVPRPHDKSLCYVGGDTRIVVVDRHTTLMNLIHRLSKTLLRSTSSAKSTSFTLKYQLPSEDLDSLISVTTDEDLENMIEEHERLNSSSAVNKSRLRLFLFPTNPESVTSIGSLLENSAKSEDWCLNALNGTGSGFSDTSSVNCLLGLDDEVSVPDKKDANHKGVIGTNLRGDISGQDVHSIPDSPTRETTSSFGSASSTPSQANLLPIRVTTEDYPKVAVGGGIEDQFSQMSVRQQHHKHQDDGVFVVAPAPAAVTGSPMSSSAVIPEYPTWVFNDSERSHQGSQMAYRKHQQQHQFQQKQSMGFDLASPDSVSSDGSTIDSLSRKKPPVTCRDPIVRAADPNNTSDQNTMIQMQQQQQHIKDSAYLMSMSTTQVDLQHPQLPHPQPQFIHTAVPSLQYINHQPSGVAPMASYYQMYLPHGQHHPHHPAMDQQNFVYCMPIRQPTQGYNFPFQQQHGYADASPATTTTPNNQAPPPPGTHATKTTQTAPKTELPGAVYRTTNSGAPQLIQVPSGQQHVGYSQIHHPSPSVASSTPGGGGNYLYELADSSQQRRHIYYAAQP